MVVFPNCKINLGLRVLSKRSDGFHDLDTVFYPLPLKDAAELVPAQHTSSGTGFELHLSGNLIQGNKQDNLCYKAWQLIRNDFPDLPPLEMYLHKAIPSGAGLGGGSSDGAFTLLLLNQVCELNISSNKLLEYALLLGSDCPFFIMNKPCHATGRGEKLSEISLDISSYSIVLVHPHIHISTAWAFAEQAKTKGDRNKDLSCADVITRPVSDWRGILVNDFELPVFKAYPQIAGIRDMLYNQGAVYASMTGTGSCVYGLFEQKSQPSFQGIDPAFTIYHLKSTL